MDLEQYRKTTAPVIDLERLDLPPAELLIAIGKKILAVFEKARDVKLDAKIQADNAKALATVITRHHFEVSHRRVFVKAWVDLLYGQAAEGESRLGAADLESMAGTTARGLAEPEPLAFDDLGGDEREEREF